MPKPDIHVLDMVGFMEYLEPVPPVTAEYSVTRRLSKIAAEYKARGGTQKSHMIGWFAQQPTKGSGAYTRRRGNESSRMAYDRFLNHYGLLWMAEAFGESEDALREAMDAAIAAEKIDYRLRCNEFRRIIPFDRIIELFLRPDGWRYDSRIFPLLDFDEETGAPFVSEEHEDALAEVLRSEHCL